MSNLIIIQTQLSDR